MAEMTTLRRERGAIQASITNFNKILDDWIAADIADRDPEYLHAYLVGVQEAFSGFSDIQTEIEELDATDNKRAEMESKYYRTIGRAKKLLREHVGTASGPASRASTPAHSSSPMSVVLPKVELPKFDGPGRAASAIQSLATTEANYVTALETLKQKFECERRTLRRHWEILCEYPRLAKDTPSALTNFVDTVYQHTRALKNLEAPVDKWDIPLITLILSKVSQNTAWQWELTLKDNKTPAYTELLEFLEKRANCSDYTSHHGTNDGNKNGATPRDEGKHRKKKQSADQSRAQTFATTQRSSLCPICNAGHRIYHCDRFKALSIDARHKAVADASLCPNCLGRNRSINDCKATTNCHSCNGRHHTSLHKHTGNQQPAVQFAPSTIQQSSTSPPGQA